MTTTTLNEDAFAPGPAFENRDPLVHDIVYGQTGHSDTIERRVINELVAIGVLIKVREITGPGWHTNIYRSIIGFAPEE